MQRRCLYRNRMRRNRILLIFSWTIDFGTTNLKFWCVSLRFAWSHTFFSATLSASCMIAIVTDDLAGILTTEASAGSRGRYLTYRELCGFLKRIDGITAKIGESKGSVTSTNKHENAIHNYVLCKKKMCLLCMCMYHVPTIVHST